MENCSKNKKGQVDKFNMMSKSGNKFNNITKAISGVVAKSITDKNKKR